jgi:hypothetical protein
MATAQSNTRVPVSTRGAGRSDAARTTPIITLGLGLSVFLAFTFTICVIGYLVWPKGPVQHESLSIFLPGFTLISWPSFFLGLVESFIWGWYSALVFGSIYNFFARRLV